MTQCNGSANGGGGTVDCSLPPGSTVSPVLPITINQCNGSGNPGGSIVRCSASITTNIVPPSGGGSTGTTGTGSTGSTGASTGTATGTGAGGTTDRYDGRHTGGTTRHEHVRYDGGTTTGTAGSTGQRPVWWQHRKHHSNHGTGHDRWRNVGPGRPAGRSLPATTGGQPSPLATTGTARPPAALAAAPDRSAGGSDGGTSGGCRRSGPNTVGGGDHQRHRRNEHQRIEHRHVDDRRQITDVPIGGVAAGGGSTALAAHRGLRTPGVLLLLAGGLVLLPCAR